MPKLYYQDDNWVVPGHQHKTAVRHDIPSTPAELADWLNSRDATNRRSVEKPLNEPDTAFHAVNVDDAATAPTLDPSAVTEWILDAATPAQIETIFAALGARYHEMRRAAQTTQHG